MIAVFPIMLQRAGNLRNPPCNPPIYQHNHPSPTAMKRYLPDTFTLMLLGTVLLATVLPATGAFENIMHLASNTAIAMLFFLHGARLSREAALSGFKQPRLHLLTLDRKS